MKYVSNFTDVDDKIIAKGILTINENIKKVGYFKLFITNLKNVLGGN